MTSVQMTDTLASGATLQPASGVTDDDSLDPSETWVWTAATVLTAETVNTAKIESMARLAAMDAWGRPVVLESRPAGNAEFGLGKGAPTAVTLADLIDEIRPELTEILRDDLEETLGRLSHSFSGYARMAAKRLQAGAPDGCLNNTRPDNDFVLTANDEGVQANDSLGSEVYDCARREWRIQSFEAKSTQDDTGSNQTILSYTRRVERMVGDDRIRGRFWGAYASHNDIATGEADGSIDGLGLYGGLYGARKLPGQGMLDYYLGGAVGRHSFSLEFPRAVTISADGSYTYAALFAGAAVSRSYTVQDLVVTPRVGVDLAWAPGARVSLMATQGARSETGSFDLGATGTWRAALRPPR